MIWYTKKEVSYLWIFYHTNIVFFSLTIIILLQTSCEAWLLCYNVNTSGPQKLKCYQIGNTILKPVVYLLYFYIIYITFGREIRQLALTNNLIKSTPIININKLCPFQFLLLSTKCNSVYFMYIIRKYTNDNNFKCLIITVVKYTAIIDNSLNCLNNYKLCLRTLSITIIGTLFFNKSRN